MSALLVIKLIDLAIMGGEAAAHAISARNQLEAWERAGGATEAQIKSLEAETDALLDRLRAAAARD